jgi:hypothetical protein
VPHRRQFLAVIGELGTFVESGAVEPENLVVGAALQRAHGRLVGILAFPDANAIELDDDGCIFMREVW